MLVKNQKRSVTSPQTLGQKVSWLTVHDPGKEGILG